MSRQLYEKISQEKLEAYLDGTLSEQETAEVDALVDSDKELQALVDEYFSIQIEMANAKGQTHNDEDVNQEAIDAIQCVMQKVKGSELRKPIDIVKRDVWIMIGAACVLVAVIFGAMVVYTPVSVEPNVGYAVSMASDCDVVRDHNVVFGEEVDYEAELAEVDAMIEQKEAELPDVAFFDRYKSEKERKDIARKRSELYELQWHRIFLLSQLQREEELIEALEEFIEINGCYRDEAIEMLNDLEDGK